MKGVCFMFPIHVNDGKQPVPDDDICYIVAKEGIFLKKKMGIMDSVAPVEKISILESIQATAKMHIKKIPGGQFAKVIAFFREVYEEYSGESIVLLFYDETKRVYKIVPPHQKVTSAACDYDKGMTIDDMQMIGTIHSHANMSAFHSGTDDKDEEHFDGLHITIGNLGDDDVSITASIVANGHRFVVQPEEYVQRLVKTVDIDKVEQIPTRRVFHWQNNKMIEDVKTGSKYTYSARRLDKRYTVNVSAKYHKVIPAWMKMVERGTPVYNYGYSVLNGWGNGLSKHGWGKHYNPNMWWDRPSIKKPDEKTKGLQSGGVTVTPGKIPHNVGVKVKPIEFPEHDIKIDDDNLPCSTCVFRTHKFLAEQEGLDIEPEIFKCEKCNSIIMDDTESDVFAECPTCKTDEHMVALFEDELPDNFISSEEYDHLTKKPGTVEDSSFIRCPECSNGFHLYAEETICPFCYASIEDMDLEGVTAISPAEEQMRQDSGGYISSNAKEIQETALKDVQKSIDNIPEPARRIPDPHENSIPIPEKGEARGFFKSFFNRGGNRK